MKRICIIILFIYISIPSIGQDNNQLNEMIIDCLLSYTDHISGLQSGGNDMTKTNSTYICKDGLPTDFPYDRLFGFNIISVESWPLYQRSIKKEMKEGMRALFVSYSLNGNQLHIMVSDKRVKLIGNSLYVELSDSGLYFFVYSCEKNTWELAETKYEGI